ncbi:MAG: hypothetical protein KDA79_05005 [Planctomycetaceae bacterium]|nr:hypothetical protein [Planctomycetaceae bacterium]
MSERRCRIPSFIGQMSPVGHVDWIFDTIDHKPVPGCEGYNLVGQFEGVDRKRLDRAITAGHQGRELPPVIDVRNVDNLRFQVQLNSLAQRKVYFQLFPMTWKAFWQTAYLYRFGLACRGDRGSSRGIAVYRQPHIILASIEKSTGQLQAAARLGYGPNPEGAGPRHLCDFVAPAHRQRVERLLAHAGSHQLPENYGIELQSIRGTTYQVNFTDYGRTTLHMTARRLGQHSA